MADGPIARSHLDAFEADGFVVVDDLLTPEELAGFGDAVDAGVAHRMRLDDRPVEAKTHYEQSFIQCINLWEDCPDVRPLTFHPRLGEAAARLLGVPVVRVWHDQALYKEPGGRGTDLHLDQPYWPLEQADTVTAWIPFDGSTKQGGAMGYLPGSHRSGVREFANIFTDTGFDLDGPEAGGIPPRWVEVPTGGVAFHHGLTMHLARPNESDRVRRVHTVIFFADGCTRQRSRQRHPSVDRPRIKRGERVASEITPIAWPRESDALPETPPLPNPPVPGWPGWPREEGSAT